MHGLEKDYHDETSTHDFTSDNINNLNISCKRILMRTGIFLALALLVAALNAQVPKLPEPVDGTYEQTFSYLLGGVVPADLNGDGNLDFVIRSVHHSGTIRIEAKLYNSASVLWSFNTGADETNPDNYRNLALIAWDFDGDGDSEVYYHYQSGGVWRHRIVNGNTGASLVDAAYPDNYFNLKVMTAIAYIGGRPRIAVNLDKWTTCRLDVFTAYNGSSWTLSSMPGFPYTNGGGEGVAHDVIASADVDANNSDDEILAGNVVLNSDGTERFHTADLVPNNTGGNSDNAIIGFFDPAFPHKLIYITGDGTYDAGFHSVEYGNNVTAVWAATGELKWNINMEEELFGEGGWEHWHSGYVRQHSGGAELLVKDKGTDHWAIIDVATGAILNSGETDPPFCTGVKPIKWDCGETAVCGDIFGDDSFGRYDLGADGCEEIIGGEETNTLTVKFNLGCSGCASRYDNRQYRQDVARMASGYSPFWSAALVLNGTTPENDPSNPPIITNVAPSNIDNNSAIITWNTHEGATSQVEYGLTTAYGSSTTLDSNLETFHSVTVSGLITGETYHFRVKSKDVDTNETVSTDYSFVCECASE